MHVASEMKDKARRDDSRERPASTGAGIATVLIVALGLLNLVQWLAHGSAESPAPERPLATNAPTDPSIKTMVVAYGPLEKRITLTGQVSLTELGHADVTAPLNGTVVEPLVHVGDYVSAGTPVAVVNSAFGQTSLQLMQKLEADESSVLQAGNTLQQALSSLGQARAALAQADTTLSQSKDNYAQANAEMTNANNDYRRKRQLYSEGVYSKSDVDDSKERWLKARAVLVDTRDTVKISQRAVDIARRNLRPAEENASLSRHNLTIARANLERDKTIYAQSNVSGANLSQSLTPVDLATRSKYGAKASSDAAMFYVRAPISGVVTAVNMTAGLAVSPNTVIASIVDTATIYVDGNAYESDLSLLKVGDNVAATSAAFPSEKFNGRISYVGKQVDPNTRTVMVRSRIANPHGLLRQGMFVTASVLSGRPRQALFVPQDAVLIQGDKHYVVVVMPDGKYEKRTVHEGIHADEKVELLDGVRPGEKVVTSGNLLVVPN